MQEEHTNLDNLTWINSILLYSADKTDTEESLRKDPDLQLLPNLIDKVVIPKLERMSILLSEHFLNFNFANRV